MFSRLNLLLTRFLFAEFSKRCTLYNDCTSVHCILKIIITKCELLYSSSCIEWFRIQWFSTALHLYRSESIQRWRARFNIYHPCFFQQQLYYKEIYFLAIEIYFRCLIYNPLLYLLKASFSSTFLFLRKLHIHCSYYSYFLLLIVLTIAVLLIVARLHMTDGNIEKYDFWIKICEQRKFHALIIISEINEES